MANLHRGGVSFRVEDRAFTLSFSTNAMCELEELTATPVLQLAKVLTGQGSPQLSTVRALLWAGLRDHHADIDLHAAGDIVERAAPPTVLAATSRALALAFPKPVEGKSETRSESDAIDWPELLKGWVEAGQPADRFWCLTLREIAVILEGAAAAREAAQKDRAWLAWHTAVLGRVKKMPKLETLAGGKSKGKVRQQSPSEMEAIARSWLGGRRKRKASNDQDHA